MTMSLTSAYARAWQQQYGLAPGWFVNTQPNDTIPLGLKGQVLGEYFQHSGPLAQLSRLMPEPSPPQDNSAWQFQSSSSIEFDAAVKGTTSGNIGWLGTAQAGVKASFGQEAGLSALGSHKWFHRFPDMDSVRTALRAAVAAGDLVEGDAVVVELQLTGPGVLLASQGGGASIEALASGSVSPAAVNIADFAGNLSVTKKHGAVTMEQFGDGAVIAARVMQVGHRGMWWWRRLVILGVEELSPREQETAGLRRVEGDDVDEYFLLF
jgi:hypothetical protein